MKTLSKEILDQEMDALRGRMRLLQQERLANVDLFETTKAANSDEIRALREENKELRQKLTQLQKLLSVDKTGHQSELSRLRKEAIQLRSEYDTLKVTSNSCKRQLNKLEGELNICELESSSNDQGSSSKIVKVLENK
jgi:chromosome segregation ATPase